MTGTKPGITEPGPTCASDLAMVLTANGWAMRGGGFECLGSRKPAFFSDVLPSSHLSQSLRYVSSVIRRAYLSKSRRIQFRFLPLHDEFLSIIHSAEIKAYNDRKTASSPKRKPHSIFAAQSLLSRPCRSPPHAAPFSLHLTQTVLRPSARG